MTMLAITLAAGLLAQSAASQTTPSTDKVTVTGCVERADQVTPTGSSLGTTVDSLDFVLMKAKEGSTAETAATSGSTSSEHAAPPAGPMYRLDAAVGTLNPHVGHKVQITGSVDAAGRSSAAAAPSAANAPTLKVDSIKMIAPTCAR